MDNETNDNQQNSDNKSEMFELEKQLHAQYATNASANTSSFFAFLVSILAVFYAFGYVYIFNTNEFACGDRLFCIYKNHMLFTLDVLVCIALISIGLLTFLICYCLELAWQQRRDQLIIYNIRKEYFNDETWKKIFGELYAPNVKNLYKFIPNLYRKFIVLFGILELIIVVLVLYKLCETISCVIILIIMGVFIIIIIIKPIIVYSMKKKFDYYKKKHQEFENNRNKEKQIN